MDIVIGHIAAFIIYAMVIAIVGGWIFIWYYKIKCHKKQKCKKEKCLYRQFCDRKVPSDAEMEKIEHYRKRILEKSHSDGQGSE